MKRNIETEPFIPLEWGSEQSGMQVGNLIDHGFDGLAEDLWSLHRNLSVQVADFLHNIGNTQAELSSANAPLTDFLSRLGFPTWKYVGRPIIDPKARIHKSLPNRLTEAHMWIEVVMTATHWKNFFALRCHHMAEVHFRKIAYMMRDALHESTPDKLTVGEWHLPFIEEEDRQAVDQYHHERYEDSGPDEEVIEPIELLKQISVARCARVSYLTHEGKRDIRKDLELYQRLRNPEGPAHASPMGHVAQARSEFYQSGPFIGFRQHRKEIPNECADNAQVPA